MTEVKQNALSSSQSLKIIMTINSRVGLILALTRCAENQRHQTHTHTLVSCHSTFFRLFRFFIYMSLLNAIPLSLASTSPCQKQQRTPLAMTRNEDGLLLLPYTPSCKHYVFLFPFFLTVQLTQGDDYYLVIMKKKKEEVQEWSNWPPLAFSPAHPHFPQETRFLNTQGRIVKIKKKRKRAKTRARQAPNKSSQAHYHLETLRTTRTHTHTHNSGMIVVIIIEDGALTFSPFFIIHFPFFLPSTKTRKKRSTRQALPGSFLCEEGCELYNALEVVVCVASSASEKKKRERNERKSRRVPPLVCLTGFVR